MQTLLLYLLIMALVVTVVFAVVWFVFGRGEDLPPLEPGTTLTRLPRNDITGHDVRSLRFQQTLRGYKQSEVDWALARLGREIDDLRATVTELSRAHPPAAPVEDAEPGLASGSVDSGLASGSGYSGLASGSSDTWERHTTPPPEP